MVYHREGGVIGTCGHLEVRLAHRCAIYRRHGRLYDRVIENVSFQQSVHFPPRSHALAALKMLASSKRFAIICIPTGSLPLPSYNSPHPTRTHIAGCPVTLNGLVFRVLPIAGSNKSIILLLKPLGLSWVLLASMGCFGPTVGLIGVRRTSTSSNALSY